MKTHGESHTKLYRLYSRMIQRCHRPKDKDFRNYGARGIFVCEAWRNDFLKFKSDMGPRPNGHTIDRINTLKGYSPSNCRWANIFEQNNNKRTNKKFTYQGETLTISQWARKIGRNKHILWARLFRKGWPIEKALTEPTPTERTHCPKGHPYSGPNLIKRIRKNGYPNRICRDCQKSSQKRSWQRKKENEASWDQ